MTDTQTCPECYSEIDARAKRCPNCGSRVKKGAKWHVGSLIGAVGLLTALCGIVVDPTALLIGLGIMVVGIVIARS